MDTNYYLVNVFSIDLGFYSIIFEEKIRSSGFEYSYVCCNTHFKKIISRSIARYAFSELPVLGGFHSNKRRYFSNQLQTPWINYMLAEVMGEFTTKFYYSSWEIKKNKNQGYT